MAITRASKRTPDDLALKRVVTVDIWRPRRDDLPALLSILLLPLLVASPQIFGAFRADPMLYVGDFARNFRGGLLPGYPYIDPNNGFTTQALGRLAAADWLRGTIPWWNPFSGVGLPLAAEFSPGAFFPVTLLLSLPNGIVWEHLLLQVLAGWGTYGLLRQLGLARLAALTGALLFAQNGTLSWFAHSPMGPTAFLPWVLLGIERAVAKASLNRPGGWRLLAAALGLILLAGFPETAYLCGLFALAWAALRLVQCEPPFRWGLAWRIALGGLIGLAIAAPQILAFAEFLPQAFLAGHAGGFAHAALGPDAVVPSLLAPYAYGPIFAFGGQWEALGVLWGSIGGYCDIVGVVAAAYGLFCRKDSLRWLLVAWIALAMAKTFGVQRLAEWWNFVPGITSTAFFRYAPPTWELAIGLLAAFGVDSLERRGAFRRGPVLAAGTAFVIGMGFLLIHGFGLWPRIERIPDLRSWALGSAVWAFVTGLLAALLVALPPRRLGARAIAGLLILDATAMFVIPTLSNPRGGEIDRPAVAFLRANLGLQRFFTLGPIQPNYGAYFGIASINHNYLPVALRWTNWVTTHLDKAADPVLFTGYTHADSHQPSTATALRRNLAAYEWAGVKYVVTPAGQDPFAEILSTSTQGANSRPLLSAQAARGFLPPGAVTEAGYIQAVGVLPGSSGNIGRGVLSITLCNAGRCVSGAGDLSGARDGSVVWLRLREPLPVSTGSRLRYGILREGGRRPEALGTYPASAGQHLAGPEGDVVGRGLQLHLRLTTDRIPPKPVFADAVMSVYQLRHPEPYFGTIGGHCQSVALSRARAAVDCGGAATLVRRALFFPGWTASVNGHPAAIAEYGGLFQAVHLAPGRNRVRFTYAPPHVIWAWLAMWLALGALIASTVFEVA